MSFSLEISTFLITPKFPKGDFIFTPLGDGGEKEEC